MGASKIGEECSRRLWYSFRWCAPEKFDGRMLRLLERGNREEAWLAEELRAIGVELYTVDASTGEQYRVAFLGGHFGGSVDGVGLGFAEAAKTWHLFEAKTSNDARWKDLRAKGVKAAKPEHYAQMQVYMHGLDLTRALYLCVNKNDDQIHLERIHYVAEEAEALISKAATVVFAPEPLTKISEDPSWWKCKNCFAHQICHAGDVRPLERNCRTCLSSTPNQNGTWWCDHHQTTLDVDAQRLGCDAHLLIPALVPWEPIAVDETNRSIVYRKGREELMVDQGRSFVRAEDRPA